MRTFTVQCGDHIKEIRQETASHAAREALRFWISHKETDFSALTKVYEEKDLAPTHFATSSLMEELGFKQDGECDEREGPVFKPRLCEHTKPIPKPLAG